MPIRKVRAPAAARARLTSARLAKAAIAAVTAAKHAGFAPPLRSGKIASTPSPISFSTWPPWPSTGSITLSK